MRRIRDIYIHFFLFLLTIIHKIRWEEIFEHKTIGISYSVPQEG
jgi:hypothetical protein